MSDRTEQKIDSTTVPMPTQGGRQPAPMTPVAPAAPAKPQEKNP
ncbi:MAG TPA: hypothetical protein VFP59_01925 [Candidatus Angelobacter sp.]|nr:hypothetical protein [Candidatus Angelobacter sp.]